MTATVFAFMFDYMIVFRMEISVLCLGVYRRYKVENRGFLDSLTLSRFHSTPFLDNNGTLTP